MKSIENAWRRSGLTQKAFAARIGVSDRTLRRYIRAAHVPVARREAAYRVAYEAKHTAKQAAQRNARVAETARRRAEVQKAREDTRPLKFADLQGHLTVVTGRRAGQLRAAYVRANQNRRSVGLPEISPRGYYGDVDKLGQVLKQKQSRKFLLERREAGREGFKKSIRTGLEYANVQPSQIADIMEALGKMSAKDLDGMYRQASLEAWDIITSPPSDDAHLPTLPDVSGLFAYLGVERKRLNIKL